MTCVSPFLSHFYTQDTWDHFDIVACDRGPPDGATQLVHWVEKVKHWVNDTKGGAFEVLRWDARQLGERRLASRPRFFGLTSELEGHYVTEKVNRSKWVPWYSHGEEKIDSKVS